MSRVERYLPLAVLLLLLLLLVEARRYPNEVEESRPHRHRHRHEASNAPRWQQHHSHSPSRKGSSLADDEVAPTAANDDFDGYDYEDYGGDESEDEEEPTLDYDRRTGRHRSPKRFNHRRYETRYPAASRYHRHRGSAHRASAVAGGGHERTAGHHGRTSSRATYHRHKIEQAEQDDDEEENGYGDKATPRRRYQDSEEDVSEDEDESRGYYAGKYKSGSRKRQNGRAADSIESKGRRSRYEPRKDWRYKVNDDEEEDDCAYDADVEDETDDDEQEIPRSKKYPARKSRVYQDKSRSDADREKSVWDRRSTGTKFDEWMKRTRSSPAAINDTSRSHDSSKKRNSRPTVDEDENEEPSRTDEDDDEVELWKDEDNDEGPELDNDFYKNDEASKPSLKTFDDIIRRLTEERTTTARPRTSTAQPKREYRGTDLDSQLRRDDYGNFKYYEETKRNTSDSDDEEEDPRDLAAAASNKSTAKRKSLLEDEDYLDDENDEDDDSTAATSSTNAPTTSTTSTTTTTTTTTTTAKPVVANNRKDARSPTYESSSSGSQFNGYQSKNDYPAMSAHSVLKWQYLGTRESVKETRNNMSQFSKNDKSAEIHAARNHALRVAKEGSCQWPRAKIIPVRDVYSNSTATYIPHCAILHRCSDDTGCCRSETLTCEAKQTQRVELYFYAIYIHGKTEIEKLSFTNHTECECRERKDFGSNGGDRLTDHRTARHFPPSPAPQNIVRPPTRKSCRCPKQFTPKITIDGVCECSCVEHDLDCLKLQLGKGYLSLTDRMCIQKEQCTSPSCTFGEFMVGQGRCPKKKDMFETTTNRRPPFGYYHRRN